MKILIKSYLSKAPFPGGGHDFELNVTAEEYTIANLLNDAKIQEDEVVLYFVNEKRVKREYLLKDGDIVKLFPVLSGG